MHNLFPWSLFPRLEKQSWVAFVPRERKNNVTAVEIWRSWNLRRRSRFTPLPLSPPIALQFEKKKGLTSNIVLSIFVTWYHRFKRRFMFHTLTRSDFIFLSFPPYSTRNKKCLSFWSAQAILFPFAGFLSGLEKHSIVDCWTHNQVNHLWLWICLHK